MLRVMVLGELALEADGRRLALPPRRSGRSLIAYLALHPGLHARGDVAALLWPDVAPSSARSSLRSALASVRTALGEHADGTVTATRDRIGLAEHARVDLVDLRELVAAGRLHEAVALASGELLQGLDDGWVIEAREEHRRELSAVLASLAAEQEARGELAAAIEHSHRAVAIDGLSEPPTRDLMRRLTAAGDRAAALAAFGRLRDRLAQELGTPPSRETRALAESIRTTESAPGDEAAIGQSPLPSEASEAAAGPFAGRDSQLASLRSALGRTRTLGTQVAFVSGEPGVGKTRLLAELASIAHDAGSEVLWGRCRSSEMSYEPLVEALSRYLRSASPARLRRDLPALAGELGPLIPVLDELVDLPPPLDDELVDSRGQLARAMLETLLATAGVLVIDDAHLADSATLRLLEHLIGGSRESPVLIALGYRAAEAPPELRRLVARARRLPGTVEVALDGLDTDAIAELAGDNAVAALLRKRTGGNPLFVNALLERTGGPGEPGLPERVTDLIAEELERLREPARQALAAASAVGDEFDLQLVAAVTAQPEDAVLDGLDEAVGLHLVRESPDTPGSYAFRHPLMREVVYAGLTRTRRAHLHRRIAAALEERDDETPVRLVAEHVLRAGDLVAPAKAARAVASAAREADEQRRHDDAAFLYERSATLLEDGPERCRLLIGLGEARVRAGDASGAADAFARAAALARVLPDHALLARAALGRSSVDSGATALLEEALGLLPEHDDMTRALVLARLARSRDESQPLAATAVSLARRSGDVTALSDALDDAHFLLAGTGSSDERLELAGEMIDLGATEGRTELLVRGRIRRAVDLLERGELAALAFEREELWRLAEELGQPAYRWWVELWRASEAILTAAPDAAELAERAYKAGAPAYGAVAELEFEAQRFWIGWQAGAYEQLAAAAAVQAERFVTVTPAWRCAAAAVAALTGELDTARVLLDELVGSQLATLRRDSAWPVAASMLAEACAVTGYAPPAAKLFELLEPIGDRWAVGASGSLCICPVSRSLGLLASAMGRWPVADRYLHDALARARSIGARKLELRIEAERSNLGAPHPL